MTRHFMKYLMVVGLLAIGTSQTYAASYTVDATTDIWLAGQPNGQSVKGYFGSDYAPDNSPVMVLVTGGHTLTFSASGSTTVDNSCSAGPDGGCYTNQSSFSPDPAGSKYNGPASALIGIFMSDTLATVDQYVASLDLQDSTNLALTDNSPLLNQIFFIGDGLTGTGNGDTQNFLAPTGATRLFLAVADSIGGSTGNGGRLTVDVTGGNVQSPVPEPATMLLFGTGIAGLAAVGRRRRS